MDITILERYIGEFVKIVYYLDDEQTHTASAKGKLTIANDSFIVEGDFNEVSGLNKDVKSCKRWFK